MDTANWNRYVKDIWKWGWSSQVHRSRGLEWVLNCAMCSALLQTSPDLHMITELNAEQRDTFSSSCALPLEDTLPSSLPAGLHPPSPASQASRKIDFHAFVTAAVEKVFYCCCFWVSEVRKLIGTLWQEEGCQTFAHLLTSLIVTYVRDARNQEGMQQVGWKATCICTYRVTEGKTISLRNTEQIFPEKKEENYRDLKRSRQYCSSRYLETTCIQIRMSSPALSDLQDGDMGSGSSVSLSLGCSMRYETRLFVV